MDQGTQAHAAGKSGMAAALRRILTLLYVLTAPVLAWFLGEQHGLAQNRGEHISGSIQLPVSSRQLRVAIIPLYAPGEAHSVAADWFSADELALLPHGLSDVFPLDYEILDPREMPESCLNQESGQYRTDLLLDWLSANHDPRYFRTIAITPRDVTAPDRNFLFGQAQIGGRACVASHYRLTGSNGYSRERQRELWHQIIQHELGHTLGLPHIEDRRSLMCYANSLAEHNQTGNILLPSEWDLLDSLHNISWDAD